jgi:hypothetical protein
MTGAGDNIEECVLSTLRMLYCTTKDVKDRSVNYRRDGSVMCLVGMVRVLGGYRGYLYDESGSITIESEGFRVMRPGPRLFDPLNFRLFQTLDYSIQSIIKCALLRGSPKVE